MPESPRLDPEAASIAADAVCRLLDDGYLWIFDGDQPPDTRTTGDATLLAELRWHSPAFAPAVDGAAEAFPILAEPSARATGEASWFRAVCADRSTPVFDGRVGTERADLVLSRRVIQAGARVVVDAYTYEQRMSHGR